MTIARFTVLMGLAAAAAAFRAEAYEVNDWPIYVAEKDLSGGTISWTGAGPFLFSGPTPGPNAGTAEGLRPFYAKITGGGSVRTEVLYPLFFRRKYPDSYKWSFYDLINGEGIDPDVTRAGGPKDKHFDVWPFYFSHDTGNPVDSYRGLLPVAGTIKYRLWFNQIHWVAFPLYVQTEKRGRTSTYTPWPIVRFVRGSEHGFDLWPLFGVTNGPGAAHHSFFVWPLAWDNVLEPAANAPEGAKPTTQFGILPLYTKRTEPGRVDVSYAWPFFGYTDETLPLRYSETRYFWPFFVQGRGDVRYVNRWGPFYTHSNNRGLDSTWVAWPLWHQKKWVDANISQTKTQFFYFVYWCLYQTDVDRPSVAPAYKRHLWPIVSIWDNGAGSRQVEFPSPLEVFFPSNPDMRQIWTPLFTLYTYDHQPTGESRHSLLWNAVTWRRNPTEGLVEFHVGPLVGMRRTMSGRDWTILGFDFGGKVNKDIAAHR
jgi:hypothetical protein